MKKLLLGSCCFMATCFSFAQQNVGIGTTTPAASAQLDVSSANKGLLPPRVSLTSISDVATIASPAAGLLVYNTATAGTSPSNVIPGYYYYTGLAWQRISNAGNAAGDLQYWNGTQWVILPAGTTGQTLSICGGVPTWGPCGGTSLATLTTRSPFSIAGTTASCGGIITADGGSPVTVRGVCYATTPDPTIANTVVNDALGGTGTYSVNLTNLSPSTLYHVRAFATNTTGTAYGGDSTFTTTSITAPTITTSAPFGIGSTIAFSGGNVSSNGGTPLTARGICYATTPNPGLANVVVTDGSAITGSYTASMSPLLPNTLYHVRAYATNSMGTSFGGDSTFTTLSPGAFAATYTFDSVKSGLSGTIDPSFVPVVPGATFGSFNAIGLSSNPNASFRFSYTRNSLGATDASDVFTSVVDSTAKYFEVTITPGPGKLIDLSSLVFKIQRSGSGARQAFVRSSIDAFSSNIGPASINPADANLSVVATNKFQFIDASVAVPGCTITLGGANYNNISTPITFRVYGINAESINGGFGIDDVVFKGIVH